jgi:hypothetical protein
MWDDVRRWEAALAQAGTLQARSITLYGQDVRRFLTWLVWSRRKRIAQGEPIAPLDAVAQHDAAHDVADRGDEGAPPVQPLNDANLTTLLAAVTPGDARAYRAYLLAHGRGRSAVHRALTSLRLFFSMRDEGNRPHGSNPFDAVSSVPRPPRAD